MNYFTSKIDTTRDQIVTIQPSATVSHQIVQYRSPEEPFNSLSTIGEEELYKLVESAKLAKMYVCMLSKLRPMLSMSNAEMLINAFMTSRLDYFPILHYFPI